MSSISQPPTGNVRVGFRGRVKNFWQRVIEGREIDERISQDRNDW
jgi:hypothetical protein